MKKLRLIPILFISLTLSYCSSDSEDQENNEQPQTNEEENINLNADNVFDGMIIPGASAINEEPPTPTGNLDFSLESTSTALVDEGFDIQFNSTNPLAGAYLIITDVDGNNAASYFDIPDSVFGLTSGTNDSFNRNNQNTRRKGDGNLSINVDFQNSLTAGNFCYSLCVYDNDGNISQPQIVCLTIQGLGGNNDLIDRWDLIRYQENYGSTNIDAGINEEFCVENEIFCDNGGTLYADECSEWDEFYIEYNSDGTYNLYFRTLDQYIDYNASSTSCSVVTGPTTIQELTSTGIWAYNQGDRKLLMAEYSYSTNINGEVSEENYPPGNANFLFDLPINIDGGRFTLTFTDVFDGMTDTVIYTFER